MSIAGVPAVLASVNIDIEHNHVVKVLGMNLYLNVIWGTVIAAVIVLALGFAVARSASSEVPGKLQVFWEFLVDAVTVQVRSSIGDRGAFVVPLAIALFIFILCANLLDLFVFSNGQNAGVIEAPSGSVNFTLALSFFTIFLVHAAAIKYRGFSSYIKHYAQPKWWLTPINIIEEIVKPITLALRLFGNMFAGALILVLIGALVLHNNHPSFGAVWVPFGLVAEIIWKLFDTAVGLIQAFIFALLTIIYFQFGIVGLGDEGH